MQPINICDLDERMWGRTFSIPWGFYTAIHRIVAGWKECKVGESLNFFLVYLDIHSKEWQYVGFDYKGEPTLEILAARKGIFLEDFKYEPTLWDILEPLKPVWVGLIKIQD